MTANLTGALLVRRRRAARGGPARRHADPERHPVARARRGPRGRLRRGHRVCWEREEDGWVGTGGEKIVTSQPAAALFRSNRTAWFAPSAIPSSCSRARGPAARRAADRHRGRARRAPAASRRATRPRSRRTRRRRRPGGSAGRVLAADNGRPVKRARVFATAAELPGGRGMLTDDSGVFDLTELPAGRYTLTVSKSGFVSLSYGQRRPLQAGTPLQLADGQQLQGDRVPAAARQRDRRPRARRGRRRDARRRWCASCATSTSRASAG